MGILFLFSAVLSFLIPIIITYYYLTSINPTKLSKINLSLTFIGFLSIIQGILSILWFFKKFTLTNADFLSLVTFLALFQTLLLLKIIVDFTDNKKIYLLLLAYLISLPALMLSTNLMPLFAPLSYLLQVILALNLTNFPNYKKPGYALILYSIASLAFISFISQSELNRGIFFVISNLLFLIFIVLFTTNLKYCPPYLRKVRKEKSSYLIEALKHFIFIVVLTNFIFIGTLSIHEFGHMGVAKFYGCPDTKIIYGDQGMPHTETTCENLNKLVGILGGLALPIAIAIFLLFVGGQFIKEIATMIVGFNLSISYRDFLDLNFSPGISLFFSLIGGAIAIIGLILLTKSRTGDEYFHFE